jgi:hypothetical protein
MVEEQGRQLGNVDEFGWSLVEWEQFAATPGEQKDCEDE